MRLTDFVWSMRVRRRCPRGRERADCSRGVSSSASSSRVVVVSSSMSRARPRAIGAWAVEVEVEEESARGEGDEARGMERIALISSRMQYHARASSELDTHLIIVV